MARIFNRDTKRVTELHLPNGSDDCVFDYFEDLHKDGWFDCYELCPTDIPSCDYEMDGGQLDELTTYVNMSNYITAAYHLSDEETKAKFDDLFRDPEIYDIWDEVFMIYDEMSLAYNKFDIVWRYQ